MTRVAVIGASGFVGRAVCVSLRDRGAEVVAVSAPRLTTTARTVAELLDDLETRAQTVGELRDRLRDVDAVVNAAGLATAGGAGDELFGADALLPGLVASAAPGGARVVHVSSAAVQGSRPSLDESLGHEAFSPYSRAKALGESVTLRVRPDAICFRPTSVQGPGRDVTRTLVKVASSPLASVAGAGARPTPQVLVENVGDAVAFVTLTEQQPPSVVLQPAEALTAAKLVRVLGDPEPTHPPTPLARSVVRVTGTLGRRSGAFAALSRRLEMLWFGQDQSPGWLQGRWSPPLGREGWERLR